LAFCIQPDPRDNVGPFAFANAFIRLFAGPNGWLCMPVGRLIPANSG